MKKLIISGDGTGTEFLKDMFVGATYPLVVKISNHLPRRFMHRPLGLVLEAQTGGLDTSNDVKITHFGELQKLCTEAAVIGELNLFDNVIELQWNDVDAIAGGDVSAEAYKGDEGTHPSPVDIAGNEGNEATLTAQEKPKDIAESEAKLTNSKKRGGQ